MRCIPLTLWFVLLTLLQTFTVAHEEHCYAAHQDSTSRRKTTGGVTRQTSVYTTSGVVTWREKAIRLHGERGKAGYWKVSIFVTEFCKWIQGRGPPPPSPPLFLDQTEARRAGKVMFGDHPPPLRYVRVWMTAPPYLKVWIRHWNVSRSAASKRFWTLFLKPLTIIFF